MKVCLNKNSYRENIPLPFFHRNKECASKETINHLNDGKNGVASTYNNNEVME